MNTLDEIRISIPPLWEREDEWRAALEEVEPEERPILRLQAELSRMLRYADTGDPKPETIAWLILWTRTYQGLEGLRGAILRRSLLTCRILERALFETAIHLTVISRPLSESAVNVPRALRRQAVEARLNKYLAWCLWNDLEEWRRFLHPANMRAAFDPRPAREYMRKFGDIIEKLPHLVDSVETLTDAEAEREREQAEMAARSRVALLERWLADSRLSDTAKYLEVRAREWKERRASPPSLFELLEEQESTILDVLKARGMGLGYSIYARGSSAIHGSSLEEVLWTHFPALGPQICATDDELSERVSYAVSWARNSTLNLYLLRPADQPSG